MTIDSRGAGRARVFVILSALCFGTTGTAQLLGAAQADPVTVGGARIIVGALGLQLVYLLTRGAGQAALWRRPASWVGILGVAAYQPLFFLGVRWTGVAAGTIVALGSAPIFTGAMEWLLTRTRPSRRWFIATTLAVLGVISLVGAGLTSGFHPLGVLLTLGAGASYATYALASKHLLLAGYAPTPIMTTLFTGGAAAGLVALSIRPAGWLLTGPGVATALWLGLVTTTLGYVLFAAGLKHLSAAETSTLTLAEPATATALGIVVLGESLTPARLLGVILLGTGLLVLTPNLFVILRKRRNSAGGEQPFAQDHEEVASKR